ncbi:MAG: hypothetical protein IMY76_00150 [Chloroflexi bacterium]|nr:hypothetical protein [Chloroflexota bacterium]
MNALLYLGVILAGLVLLWVHIMGLTRFIGKLFLILGWGLIAFGTVCMLDLFF